MQNPIYLHRPGHLAALSLHLGSPETTLVLGEVPVGRDLRQRRGLRVPDLIIAFGVDPGKIIADRGYSIEQWSKPPDFVLEIASESTAENDVTGKRDDYAAFGIPEYWRFDPSGGSYYGAPLSGDRLTSSGYQPIEIVRVDEAHHRGHSFVLGLDLCWEEGQLRWYDPASLRYVLTFDETEEARIAAEARVRELEAEIRRLRD
jgi:Uma2 family endonuclease